MRLWRLTSKKVLSFGMRHRNATASTLEFEILRYTLKIFSSNHNQPFNNFFLFFFNLQVGRSASVTSKKVLSFGMKHRNATASTLKAPVRITLGWSQLMTWQKFSVNVRLATTFHQVSTPAEGHQWSKARWVATRDYICCSKIIKCTLLSQPPVMIMMR